MSEPLEHPHERLAEAGAVTARRTPPVIHPGHTFESVNETISRVVLGGRHPIAWFVTLGLGILGVNLLGLSVGQSIDETASPTRVEIRSRLKASIPPVVRWTDIGDMPSRSASTRNDTASRPSVSAISAAASRICL